MGGFLIWVGLGFDLFCWWCYLCVWLVLVGCIGDLWRRVVDGVLCVTIVGVVVFCCCLF